ncbi:hypothetical protein [Labrys miyagiensis]
MPEAPAPPLISLAQAARRLDVEARHLGNVARQHGFFTAVGRDLYFTEEQLAAADALLKDRARAEKKAASRKRKPPSTYGVHESTELRKQRRRDKKRQIKKEEE